MNDLNFSLQDICDNVFLFYFCVANLLINFHRLTCKMKISFVVVKKSDTSHKLVDVIRSNGLKVKSPRFQNRTSAFLKPFCVEDCINFHMSPLMYPCGRSPHGYIKGDIWKVIQSSTQKGLRNVDVRFWNRGAFTSK